MKELIILLGAPGSGKGTQARFLKERFGIPSIGMGEILRNEVDKNTALGKEISASLKTGQYLKTSFILEILFSKLSEIKEEHIVLDGVPRSLEQAQSLEPYFNQKGYRIAKVILLNITPETIMKRVSQRSFCRTCGQVCSSSSSECSVCGSLLEKRSDDQKETVLKRISVYQENIVPLLDFYKDKGVLMSVDSEQDLSVVQEVISKEMLKILQKDGASSGNFAEA